MTGKSLELATTNYAKQTITQLSDFLVYMKDRTARTDLFADNERKMNIVYHQVWYFRNKLIRNYNEKPDDFDLLPEHLYSQYKSDARQSVKALLDKDDTFQTSVLVPDFLVTSIKNVTKKLESIKLPPEGPVASLDAQYYVTKDGDQYFYDGVPLKLQVGSEYCKAFNIVFDVTKGKGGICAYEVFDKELSKRDLKFYKKLKAREGNGLRDWSQDNLTVKSKGILNKVVKKDLITTKEGVGFVFNNKK